MSNLLKTFLEMFNCIKKKDFLKLKLKFETFKDKRKKLKLAILEKNDYHNLELAKFRVCFCSDDYIASIEAAIMDIGLLDHIPVYNKIYKIYDDALDNYNSLINEELNKNSLKL